MATYLPVAGAPLRRASMGVLALLLGGCAIQPQPFTNAELQAAASDRAARIIGADQEPLTGPLDLYEAMARAIKYNLDHRIELMQEALRVEELELGQYDMLPDLVASGEFSSRTNEPGATSISLLTGTESLEPSRSTEEDVLIGDLTLSWDILDFGLSYVRSRQQADEVLIALEQRRSTINRIIQDVRTAYWRAVSAERLLSRLEGLKGRVEGALAKSEALVDRRVTAPLPALEYQRELLTINRSIQELQRDLAVAKRQLAALINLRQGEDFELVMPDRDALAPSIDQPVTDLVELAYVNRPELREIGYRLRINEWEEDSAILELLPSIRGFIGFNGSTNDLLFNQTFFGLGARVTWDLLNIFRYPQRRETVEAQETLLDARALALTQAVAVQVHVSKARFEALREEAVTAAKLNRVNGRILTQTQRQARAGAAGEQALIREELNAILAELQHDAAYADLQNAFGSLYASIGLDAFAGDLTGQEDVDTLSTALRDLWAGRGDRPFGS